MMFCLEYSVVSIEVAHTVGSILFELKINILLLESHYNVIAWGYFPFFSPIIKHTWLFLHFHICSTNVIQGCAKITSSAFIHVIY